MAARRYSVLESSQTLQKACKDKILDEFVVASESSAFLSELDYEALVDIISSDDLHAEEKDVLDSVINWIEADHSNRIQYLDKCLEYIRFPVMPASVLVHIENSVPILKDNQILKDLLFEALKHNIDISSIPESVREESRFRPRASINIPFTLTNES